MKTCRDCLYEPVCSDFRHNICETDKKRFEEYRLNSDGLCDYFKDKSLVLDLPCKVGSKIYQLDSAGAIYESEITNIIYATNGIAFDSKAIGRRVFFSREAAEQALKEYRNDCV